MTFYRFERNSLLLVIFVAVLYIVQFTLSSSMVKDVAGYHPVELERYQSMDKQEQLELINIYAVSFFAGIVVSFLLTFLVSLITDGHCMEDLEEDNNGRGRGR